VGDVAKRSPSVLLLGGNAEHPQVSELAPKIGREDIVMVNLGGTRRDFLLGKRAHAVSQHLNRFTQIEIKTRYAHRITRTFGEKH
jgi:hypothetical protein